MNNIQQTARVGLFFLLGLALTWVTFQTLSGGKVFRNQGYTIIAGFESVKDLKQGDEVRMAGVKIGSIELTHLVGRRAEAVLRIDPEVEIKADATASIIMSGLLGTNYVSLDLGTADAPPLRAGAEIRTKATPDINSIMTDLGALGQKLDSTLGSISKAVSGDAGKPGLFQKLDTLVTENSEKVGTTMTNLRDITTKINEGEGTLGKLVNDPQIHDDLVATVGEIKAAATEAKTLLANAQTIVDQVKAGQGTLGVLVYDETAGNNLKATAQNIRDVTDKLARGEGTLGKLINDDSLFRDTQAVLKKADTTLDGMGDSGPITAVGVVAKSLF